MNVQQLEQIAALRQHNYPYSFIARELAMPLNTVKSICRRRLNRGEVRKYFVENSHEAIIDEETFSRVQAEIVSRAAKHRKENHASYPHLFNGYLRCGHCGKTLGYFRTNAGKYDKAVWACPTYYTLGKDICPSQRIPEDILIEKTKEVLSLDELDREALSHHLREIIVPAHYQLRFILKDGTVIDVAWKHRSRSESWTPEMKQAVRERNLKRQRERKKNEQ